MNNMSKAQAAANQILKAAKELEPSLLNQYGQLIGGPALWHALGYPSYSAFARALERDALAELPLFKIPRRRGVFCLTSELAIYLAKAKLGQLDGASGPKGKEDADVS
jgi:hypothetical protein